MSEIKCPGDCTDTGCCAPKKPKPVIIEYLYLDLDTCDRCQDTLSALDEAIKALSGVMNAAGLYIEVNKILIDTRQKAIEHKLECSPTVRVNGVDIDGDMEETSCACCSDICGDDVDCRVWNYEGEQYTSAPKKLLMSAILKAIYGETQPTRNKEYVMPDNLEKFFSAKEAKDAE